MIIDIMVKHQMFPPDWLLINRCYDDKSIRHQRLQTDWNLYGNSMFEFVILYIGEDWQLKSTRLNMESTLITQNKIKTYNMFESFQSRVNELNVFYQKRHSEKTKKQMSLSKKNIPNDILGF